MSDTDLVSLLLKNNEVVSASLSREDEQQETAHFTLRVGELEFQLIMKLPDDFPRSLPKVILEQPSQHGLYGKFHDHVNWEGDLCYIDKGVEIFVDESASLSNIIKEVVERVGKTLNESLKGDLTNFFDEFEGYWRGIHEIRSVHLLDSIGCNYEVLSATVCNKRNIRKIYKEPLEKSYGFIEAKEATRLGLVFHIPLAPRSFPPTPKCLLDVEYVRGLFNQAHDEETFCAAQQVGKITRNRKRKARSRFIPQHFGLLFSMPRPSGGRSLWGVEVKGRSRTSFLTKSVTEKWQVTPLRVKRHYPEYLIERGGSDLQSVSVAIVGCGAVGSRVVELLIQAGVQKLTLVDNDNLSEENIYRHLLGGAYTGFPKVNGLMHHLSYRFPKVRLTAENCSREEWIKKNELNDFDLVIDATGDITGMRALNDYMFKLNNPIPVIYTFVEPYSLGGHALFVPGDEQGCLNCFITADQKGPRVNCLLLEPYQVISKDMLGCSSFVPFTATDSFDTASLATRLGLEALQGNVITPTYRCWKGTKEFAEKSSLKVKRWFDQMTPDKINQSWKRLAKKGCDVCKE